MGVKSYSYSDRHPGGDAPRRMIGDGMRVRQGFRALGATVLTIALLSGAIVLASAGGAGAQSASTSAAPGVTSNSITVGTISTQTGTLASNFSSLIYGEKAYYDYINAQGGVNGRKIDYKYALDDGGNPTTFNQLANTLINQDHVFAVTGVATAFFSPNLFVESGIPTYGYNVTGNWAGPGQPLRRRGLRGVLPRRCTGGGLRGPQDAAEAVHRVHRLRDRGVGRRLPVGAECDAGCRLQHQLLGPQGELSRLHRRHRRAAHEAGGHQLRRQLHGRAGQRHDGPGDPAVRAAASRSCGSTGTTSRRSTRTRA